MQKAVKQLQEAAQNLGRDLLFRVDEECGRTIIEVVDSHTDELIRQISPQEILDVVNDIHVIHQE